MMVSLLCFQAIGAQFQYMSWPQFVEMVINNELPRHPELGNDNDHNYNVPGLNFRLLQPP